MYSCSKLCGDCNSFLEKNSTKDAEKQYLLPVGYRYVGKEDVDSPSLKIFPHATLYGNTGNVIRKWTEGRKVRRKTFISDQVTDIPSL